MTVPAGEQCPRCGSIMKQSTVENDVQESLKRIEARLEAIEALGKQLKADLAETSSNVLASGQLSGADSKLDEILQILKAEE